MSGWPLSKKQRIADDRCVKCQTMMRVRANVQERLTAVCTEPFYIRRTTRFADADFVQANAGERSCARHTVSQLLGTGAHTDEFEDKRSTSRISLSLIHI